MENDSYQGISIAGNIIADIVKTVNVYPQQGMMAYISDITRAVGGCVPNVAIDIAKMDPEIPVTVYGKIGDDGNGSYILEQMRMHGINTDGISVSGTVPTSFCDVMSIAGGERTFFHKKGANAEFSPKDIDINAISCKILHIGYIMLMDRFDEEDEEYGTVMAGFLCELQKKGIKTSIDVVSNSLPDYGKKIIPSLKYCNYVIVNEVECCNIWNMSAYTRDGRPDKANIKYSMRKMIESGVKDKVIIHCKETSFVMDALSGVCTEVCSLNIPKNEMKGSVGAGDAFCAGCLYALYNGFSDREMLEYASAAAATSLFSVNSVDGVRSKSEIIGLKEKYGRLSL